MQIRKVPMLLSMLITMALLFGGWYFYQKVNVESPIRTEIGQLPSVSLADLNIDQDQVDVRLNVKNPDQLPDDYTKLVNMIEQTAPGKQVNISLTNQNEQLKKIWSNGLFTFTEAMDLHEYSKIPKLLDDMKSAYKLDKVETNMDDKRVYVFLKRGNDQFFAIVPKTDNKEVIARG